MDDILVPQALLAVDEAQKLQWLGHSADFQDDWRESLEKLCHGFGPRPAGVRCPAALFAQPLGRSWVAIARVADLGTEAGHPPSALGFHFLVLPATLYANLGGDPFVIAAALPVNWHLKGSLPSLSYQPAVPRRTVAELQEILKRNDGPTLLGAVQALLDGCRVAWVRSQPDDALIRSLWMLLPTTSRCDLWPATFAFSNALGFHALVVPAINPGDFSRQYLSEEQADNYPEGGYELALQTAVEADDQAWLDTLFARRSRRETWRLGWWLLAALTILTVAFYLLKAWMK